MKAFEPPHFPESTPSHIINTNKTKQEKLQSERGRTLTQFKNTAYTKPKKNIEKARSIRIYILTILEAEEKVQYNTKKVN